MNPDHDQRLETAMDRELGDLPELPAPDTLIPRVMAAIRQRELAPWYRRPWPLWPTSVRAVSLLILLAVFGGLCSAGWKVSQTASVTTLLENANGWISGWRAVGSTLNALGGAVVLLAKQLGTGFIIAALAVAALNYVACIGLGTVCLRLVFARRTN